MDVAASPGILELAAEARSFQIDWAVYKQSHFLNDDEFDIISKFVQQRTEEARASFIGENGVPLFKVFISLLSKVRCCPGVMCSIHPLYDAAAEMHWYA